MYVMFLRREGGGGCGGGGERQFFISHTKPHKPVSPSTVLWLVQVLAISYSQALRLNRICSDSESFDKRCNDLEGWLMEREYNGKMIRRQILRAREHSRKDILER